MLVENLSGEPFLEVLEVVSLIHQAQQLVVLEQALKDSLEAMAPVMLEM
jgi:hypothetical protein